MTFDVINVCIITLVFQWKNTLFCQLFSDLFFKRSKRDSNDTNLTYAHRRLINKFMKLILHLFACIATNPYTNSLTSRESPPIDAANKRFATQYKPNVIWTVRERTTCTRVVTQFQICSAWFAFFFFRVFTLFFAAHFCHSAASFNNHIKRHQHLLLWVSQHSQEPIVSKSRLSKHAFNCGLFLSVVVVLFFVCVLRMLMLTSMLLHFNKMNTKEWEIKPMRQCTRSEIVREGERV